MVFGIYAFAIINFMIKSERKRIKITILINSNTIWNALG